MELQTPKRKHKWNCQLQKGGVLKYIKRNLEFPKSHFLLLGPRGTGKSTLLKHHIKNSLYVDLLLTDNFREYSAKPEKLKNLIKAYPEKDVVIIDEIQKVPNLLSIVHSLIEEKEGKQFILTGSSARKLRKQGTNLLAGRAYKKTLHPFTGMELKTKFNLEDALQYGLIPVVISSPDKKEALKAYVELYIREEVMMEGLTRNIGNFTRFLESISFSHGSVLNITNVARECQIERKVVESYIGILEDLLIAKRVPVFTKKAKRHLISHPKFYFFDTGLYRELRPSGPLDMPEEIGGAALEGLVYQNLRAYIDNSNLSADIFFWRTKNGNEVDFIIYGEDLFTAVEVKNSTVIRPNDLKSLKSFNEDYPSCKTIMIYRGKKRVVRDDILIIPSEEFFPDLKKFMS